MYSNENEKSTAPAHPGGDGRADGHRWPGNVRELENVIERAVVLSTGEEVGVDLLPASLRAPETMAPATVTLPKTGVSFKEAGQRLRARTDRQGAPGLRRRPERAAERLKVKPTTLHEMMKRLRVTIESRAS